MADHFTRQEVKYKLSGEMFKILTREFTPYLKKDKFFFEKIHNVYYDTEFDENIRFSLEKPVYKEKLRLRAYELDGALYSYAFIELKKKFDGIVYKRREKMLLSAAREVIAGSNPAKIFPDTQISREILFFLQKTKCYPKVYLAYNRYSYRAECDENLRITFDEAILSRTERLDFCADSQDKLLVDPRGDEVRLMEVKSANGFPLWMTKILSHYKVYPVSFSKYGKIYENSLTDKVLEEMCHV